jgi:hypothetical protein
MFRLPTPKELSLFSCRPGGCRKNLPEFHRRSGEENSIPYRLDEADG